MDSLSLEETIWLITNLIFPPFDMKEAKAVASTLIVAELKYPSCKSNSELLFNASEKNVQDCIHHPPYTFHRLTIQRLAT